MLRMLKRIVLGISLTLSPWLSASDFMDASWAKNMCSQWNQNAGLSQQLGGETWVDNNAGRGYKLIQLYRTECGASTKIQLTIKNQQGKAICTYGGKPNNQALDSKVDYVLHAKDKHWVCIGAGKFGCGAAGALSTGKLQLKGSMAEVKSVMQPFSTFLKLVGQVPGKKGAEHCPR